MSTHILPTPLRLPPQDHVAQVDSLRRHLQQCHRGQGRWFGAAQWAERVHGWCAPRLVTTVALACVVLAAATSWA